MKQQERSTHEKSLPEWLRNALDMARAGISPTTNSKITPEEAKAFVNAWLPEGDSGRLR